jgi:signal transduction histidine kinase
LLFVIAATVYRSVEVVEEFDGLSPTVNQAIQGAKGGHADEEVTVIREAEPEVSIAIFKDGQLIARTGHLDVSGVKASGRMRIQGTEVTSLTEREGAYFVVAARPWRHREEILRHFVTVLALLWPLLVGLIAGATALASRATFRPLDELRRQADAAHMGGLHGRLHLTGHDEYSDFAASLNGFLDSIETLVRNEEQFVADAAHELRTPLTALRGRVETALLRNRSPEEYRAALAVVLEEAERLSDLVEALLGSATAAWARPAAPLDLQPEVERAHARWLDRFTEIGVALEAKAEPGEANVTPSEFGSVIDNLLGNALRASPPGTVCSIELKSDAKHVRLAVQDGGPGIPPELRERIFDRFVRGEESRNRATGGFGIGLSLCRRIVEGRGGRIWVEPTERGARFEVELPVHSTPLSLPGERGRG